MSHVDPTRERIAAVFADGRQGSGYFLTPRLVLTAAHVVAGGVVVTVAAPGVGKVKCDVLWSRQDDRCDVALLVARSVVPSDVRDFPGVRLGSIQSLTPLPNCQAIGFPQAQRDAAGRLDSEQLVGTLKPGSNILSRRHVLDNVHTPPRKQKDGNSPWAGFSGAVLFYSDVIVGVVGHDPGNWQHGRLEATPVSEFCNEPSFIEALDGAAEYIQIPDDLSPERIFEERYREYIATKFGTLTIFGIDLNDRSQAEWPLDAAYLSLEVMEYGEARREGGADREVLPVPSAQSILPADRALDGNERVLLRGVAGSGKTTLVQWLAVSTARRERNSGLQHLHERVPFLLPLRTLIRNPSLPIPEEFLTATRIPLSGLQPQGWTEKVLLAQRGLILVDGLDEISEGDRERVRNWLRELLIAFPGNSWLVTSRPSAVSDEWLASEDFIDLSLSPMHRKDVETFVRRWHSAAGKSCRDSEEALRLIGYEGKLLAALRAKQDLGRLATNPLMCGLICALHRDRRGYLPPGRKQLYDAALSMLLARRDREREIDVLISEETQIQLLQKLAYWLIRNGQVEMDRADAVSIIEAALPSMPILTQLGDAAQVYRYLLLRSGLLREPTDGAMDFIHRTFQDYLGAKAAVEERDFDLMVKNAHHDQWEDVLRMAVAHAYPAEKTRLLNKLIKRGDRVKRHKTRLYLLAMACLEQAAELDPEIRREIEKRASELIPPSDYHEAKNLANAGTMVLDLLPGPSDVTQEQARWVVETIVFIGTDAAIPALARYRENLSDQMQDQLARAWSDFDIRTYGQEIVSYLPESALIWVTVADQLNFLREIGGRPGVIVKGDHSPEMLVETLNLPGIQRLGLHSNESIRNIEFLGQCVEMNSLFLYDCSLVSDLSPINDIALKELSVNDMFGLSAEFRGLSAMKSVDHLSIMQEIPGVDLSVIPREASLRRLSFSKDALVNTGLRGLSEIITIEDLRVQESSLETADWAEANRLPNLSSLSLDRKMLDGLLAYRKCWPKVERIRLMLRSARGGRAFELADFVQLAEKFPGLRSLSGVLTEPERSFAKSAFSDIDLDGHWEGW